MDEDLSQAYVLAKKRTDAIVMAGVLIVRVAIGIMWTVVAVCLFLGRTIPLVGLHADRSLVLILVWLVFGGPLLFFVGRFVAMLLVLPISLVVHRLTTRRARAAGVDAPFWLQNL